MGNEKNNKDAVGVRINVYSIREPIGVYMSSVIESVCSFPCQYTKLDTSAGNCLRHNHVIFSLLALLSEGQKMPPQTSPRNLSLAFAGEIYVNTLRLKNVVLE